jgi:hypothetical protein
MHGGLSRTGREVVAVRGSDGVYYVYGAPCGRLSCAPWALVALLWCVRSQMRCRSHNLWRRKQTGDVNKLPSPGIMN